MNRWIYTACLAGVMAMSSMQANAATFVAGDHPDGELWTSAGKGPYGLRLDKTLFSVGNNILVTSAANVVVAFDPSAGTASLTGTMQMTKYKDGAPPVNPGPSPELWSLVYNLTDITFLGVDGSLGFTATGGSGVITDLTPGDSDNYFDTIYLTGKQDGDGVAFYFEPNGFRIAGDDSTWVGNGWVTAKYYKKDGTKVRIQNTMDFLITAQPDGDTTVPEPSTMLLTMGGVALLWFRKRRS